MRSVTKPMVVVAGGSDPTPAVTRAIKIAVANGTSLKILEVTAAVPEIARATLSSAVIAELRAALREQHEEKLRPLVHTATQVGVAVNTVLRAGTPFLETIRETLTGGHDLVLKTAGEGNADEPVFTGTDKHLLRKCPCPIWLVAPGAKDSARRILAAVDPDPTNSEQEELSRDVLRAAIEVAHSDTAHLDVLHAWHLFGESLLRGPRTSVPDPEVDHLVGNALNRHASAMDELLESIPNPGIALQRHLLRGRASDTIVSLARDNDIGLLVMGTVGRTGIPGLLIGNTAERVIDLVKCSILALKPRGFVSPVTVAD